jgi:hypothetical protein
MIRLLLGAVLGGWVVWRWRSQIARYLDQLPDAPTKAADLLDQGKEKLKEGLQATQEAIRPSESPPGPRGPRSR